MAGTLIEKIGREWRSRLKGFGFAPQGTGGRRGTYRTRKVGTLVQAVGVLVDEERRGGAFNVQLNINMNLPASEPSHDVVVLLADLSPTGVRIQEAWVHEGGLTTWSSSAEMELAWKAFEDHGVPWLDRYGQAADLISYFESEYQRLAEADSKNTGGGWIRGALTRLGLARGPMSPGYQQYLLWLSMLYGEEGNTVRAVELLDVYQKWVEERGMKGELERLTRHRALLTA